MTELEIQLLTLAGDAEIAAETARAQGKPEFAAHMRTIEMACREEFTRAQSPQHGERRMAPVHAPLHELLLSRAIELERLERAKSVEHGLVEARRERELAHNKELHDAHVIALEAWHEAQSEARAVVNRRTLEQVGAQLRAE